MKVIPITWNASDVQIEGLGELVTAGMAAASYGIAAFPAGVRHPPEGMSAHEGTEISFILDGAFDVETPDGTFSVTKDSLVIIPAGEPHATRASTAGRVAYFLLSEIGE